MFFDQLFADTAIDKLPENQRIIVREPKYYQQLNLALEEDSDFTKQGLGSHPINNTIYSSVSPIITWTSRTQYFPYQLFIANYMFLRIAMSFASQGPKELEDIDFKFESKISGASYRPPR